MIAPINCLQEQASSVYACDCVSKCFGRHEYPLDSNVGSLHMTCLKLSETTGPKQSISSQVETFPIHRPELSVYEF